MDMGQAPADILTSRAQQKGNPILSTSYSSLLSALYHNSDVAGGF